MARYPAAWNTLAWFAALLTLADGLNRIGFVTWFAESVAQHMGGFSPITAMILLVVLFYFIHYMFASIIAHVTAVLLVTGTPWLFIMRWRLQSAASSHASLQ